MTFESALADGDELAMALERVRELQGDLVTAVEALADVEAALQSERRRHRATQRTLDRTRATMDEQRAADQVRAEELRVAADEVRRLTAENQWLSAQLAERRPPAAGPNRAARRQAAKRDRHTER